MTIFYVIWFLLFPIGSEAKAGAPPSHEIPWDTVFTCDTVQSNDGEFVEVRHTCEYITRTEYEVSVLGNTVAWDLCKLKHDAEVLKALISADIKKKANKP